MARYIPKEVYTTLLGRGGIIVTSILVSWGNLPDASHGESAVESESLRYRSSLRPLP
jgi:hypothetical protein